LTLQYAAILAANGHRSVPNTVRVNVWLRRANMADYEEEIYEGDEEDEDDDEYEEGMDSDYGESMGSEEYGTDEDEEEAGEGPEKKDENQEDIAQRANLFCLTQLRAPLFSLHALGSLLQWFS
jgi:hypothetical protein